MVHKSMVAVTLLSAIAVITSVVFWEGGWSDALGFAGFRRLRGYHGVFRGLRQGFSERFGAWERVSTRGLWGRRILVVGQRVHEDLWVQRFRGAGLTVGSEPGIAGPSRVVILCQP